MEAVKGNLGAPPKKLEYGRVLEYLVFGEQVERSSAVLLSDAFALTLPIEGLAICQSSIRSARNKLVLCFVASDWEVDSVQYSASGSDHEAASIDEVKARANELFLHLDEQWTHVSDYEFREAKWWQFWR